ncbi:hypothetical protein NHX12_024597 [Muraenolepis orangiensis]|uniref:Uncharacterized protein n=1 Tax=Muraenolepis orangiensis TaxID=630683 RepID=A0A9Q0EKN3_9TELE|nr:hypothetical protein NHX12_024597 [Muraenolepis orangiensis]
MGRKKFNMDPKKFLLENDLLQHTPEDVSQFLYKGEGLNKTAIGDYLGESQFLWSFRLPGEAQKIDRMMEAFASRYCQCNPGVFQSTDTCYVLSFAIIMLNTSLHNPNVRDKPPVERFISMNRGINEGGDLPEELLRNLYDSIKNEPFKIPEDDGNDLTHTFFNPDREGWLLKLERRQGVVVRVGLFFLRRMKSEGFHPFSLILIRRTAAAFLSLARCSPRTQASRCGQRKGVGVQVSGFGDEVEALGPPHPHRARVWSSLQAAESKSRAPKKTDVGEIRREAGHGQKERPSDKEPRGIIPLENLSIREVDEPRKPNCFELYNPNHKGQVIKACKTEADGRVVEGNHVVYRISAPTPEEKEEWIKSIKASISRDPFYDMLATRKRRIANKK